MIDKPMKKCALCKERDANKTNTHYLTDGIIRSTLNEGGCNERDKGLHFDISNDQAYTEFNFQRKATPEKLEEFLGRPATDEEIEKSKQSIAFSVDNVFCSECESVFTQIENEFMAKLLPKMRGNAQLARESEIVINESGLFRLFWLMQIWRSSICEKIFEITSETSDKLRLLILEGLDADETLLKSFPLAVTFLFTGDDPYEYTANRVGVATGNKPNLLFMNEFVIQFYETPDEICFLDFYGLNDSERYLEYINLNEGYFVVSVKSFLERKLFYERMTFNENVKPKIDFFTRKFVEFWKEIKGIEPSLELQEEYRSELVDWDHIPFAQRLSKKRIQKFTIEFVDKRINR